MKPTTIIRWTLGGLILTLSPTVSPPPAAAITVFDPTNLAQNVLSAVRTLKSNVNEAIQIKQEVQSLANEARNLEKLDFSIIDDFSSQMNSLFEVAGSVNGLMQDFNSLTEQFQELYPDLAEVEGFNIAQMLEQNKNWLNANRETILGAARTGAQILESLPRSQAQLEELLTQSHGAVGIVQATQAGNQIAANVAGSLQALNAQMATYSQAHMQFMMQQTQTEQANEAMARDSMATWGKKLDPSTNGRPSRK